MKTDEEKIKILTEALMSVKQYFIDGPDPTDVTRLVKVLMTIDKAIALTR